MTIASDEQLNRLRQRPHRTTLHLSVYEPNTVLAARINMPAISRGERVIEITILGGNFNNVDRGMTCYIGTTPGGQDVNRVRAISAAAATLEIAENDFNLRDGMYVTVVSYYEPWAVFPRILLDANNIPLFYKDYNIPYSDQNQFHDPVVHMGPNHAAFLENTPSGSYAPVWYTASGTFDPTDDSIPTGYAWTFEGGDPPTSTVPDPGYVDYTGAGHFLTSLEVTSNFGKTFIGRRHISIYTRPDQGPARPIVAWGMSSFEGARENGGYSIRLWIREEADYSRVVNGALIVIFTDDGQGAFDGAMGGNAENRSSILFNGYIEDESISINPVTNRLEFRVTSVTGRMKRLAGFSASYQSKRSGWTSSWNEMTDMTVDKAMIGFLRWQSTILTIADYQPTGNTLDVQFMDFERANIYDALNNLLASSLVATAVADRQGKIWTEIDASCRPTGSARAIDSAISITRQDWRAAIDIEVAHEPGLSYLEMGGIAYSGPSTGTMYPFLGGAPGDAPAYFGGLERVSGLVIAGQEQLNELVGLAWARANREYPEVIVPIAGDYRILDIAPQERVLVSLEEDDTWRGYVWDEKPFIPASLRYTYQAEDQVLLQEVTLSNETDGPPGESVEIPVDPPFPSFLLPEFYLPPLILPPPIDPIPIDPAPGTGALMYVMTGNRLGRSRNFGEEDVLDTTWDNITPGGAPIVGSVTSFYLDPVDPMNRCYLVTHIYGGGAPAEGPYLFRGEGLNSASPTWTLLMDANAWRVVWNAPGSGQIAIRDIAVSRVLPNVLWAIGQPWGLGGNTRRMAWSVDYGATWTENTPAADYRTWQNANCIIQASEWTSAAAFASGHKFFGDDVLYTLNGGAVWWGSAFNQPQDFYVPYQGNEGDQDLYVSEETGATKKLMYDTARDGIGRRDITPFFGGYYWACARSGNSQGNYRQIRGAWNDSNVVIAMLQRRMAEPDADLTTFFMSTTGPDGLIARRQFSGRQTCLMVHRNNDNLFYALSHYQAPGSTHQGNILYSPDAGETWRDYKDSWIRDMGVNVTTPIRIEPAWTV